MNSSVGSMTYDRALMNYGPPSRTSQGNSVYCCEWRTAKTEEEVSPMLFSGGIAFDFENVTRITYRTLCFSKKSNRLVSWTYRDDERSLSGPTYGNKEQGCFLGVTNS